MSAKLAVIHVIRIQTAWTPSVAIPASVNRVITYRQTIITAKTSMIVLTGKSTAMDVAFVETFLEIIHANVKLDTKTYTNMITEMV